MVSVSPITPAGNRLAVYNPATAIGRFGGDGASLMPHGSPNTRAIRASFGEAAENLLEQADTARTTAETIGTDLERAQGNAEIPEDHVQRAGEILNHAGMGAAMLAAPVLGGLGWVAAKTGLPGATSLKGASAYLHKPVTEVGVGQKFIGLSNRLLSPAAGILAPISNGIGLTAFRVNGLETKAAKLTGLHNNSLGIISAYAEHPQMNGQLRQALAAVKQHLEHGGAALAQGAAADLKALNEVNTVAMHLAKDEGHKPLVKALKGAEKNIGKLAVAKHKISAWNNLEETIRNPKSLHEASVAHTAGNLLWGAASLTSAYVSARDIGRDIEALRELVADVTHTKKDDVTFNQMMFEELPEPASSARSSLIKVAGPRAVLEAMGVVFNLNMALRGGSFLLTMIPQLAGWGVSVFTDNSVLDSYKEMKANEEKHLPSAPETYAKLVGSANEELLTVGGANSQFAQAIGAKYAEQKLSAKQVLDKVMSGEVSKEIEALKNPAKQANAAEEVKPEKSHVDMVRKQQAPNTLAMAAPEQMAKGHAGKIMQGRLQPAVAQIS